ncbi:ATP-binding protein [Termitidicoccus mucosus]|jgi:hypothetical protein|uniref:Zona occludens toxin N-terminal domain-containing protein n=1 Tax=Termitidicoccus mucosus TaxID=1184151 RepID=A0A178IC21_9BACT|nr:hypothetical protein AW736_21890 [Opitutaceae bacterium TSB47]
MSIHVGIFGPSLCGKTYAAIMLSLALWRQERRRSIVLDPNGSDWGPHAIVFRDMDRFLAFLWRHRNCAVFIDEATLTIDRGVEFTDLFTRVRHAGHILHIMGHRATVLLPIQRDQFGKLLLFRQSPGSAKIWGEEWAEPRMVEATELKKYEFLYCVKFGAPDGSHLIQRGKFPPP